MTKVKLPSKLSLVGSLGESFLDKYRYVYKGDSLVIWDKDEGAVCLSLDIKATKALVKVASSLEDLYVDLNQHSVLYDTDSFLAYRLALAFIALGLL